MGAIEAARTYSRHLGSQPLRAAPFPRPPLSDRAACRKDCIPLSRPRPGCQCGRAPAPRNAPKAAMIRRLHAFLRLWHGACSWGLGAGAKQARYRIVGSHLPGLRQGSGLRLCPSSRVFVFTLKNSLSLALLPYPSFPFFLTRDPLVQTPDRVKNSPAEAGSRRGPPDRKRTT